MTAGSLWEPKYVKVVTVVCWQKVEFYLAPSFFRMNSSKFLASSSAKF